MHLYFYSLLCYLMNKKKGNDFVILNGVCDSYKILIKIDINCRSISLSSNIKKTCVMVV
jgi:hypothetical protein